MRNQAFREESEFNWNIPEEYNIVDEVAAYGESNPDKVAFYWENESGDKVELSYSVLVRNFSRFGSYLDSLGIGGEDPVMHILPRVPEVFTIQLGTLMTGAIAVPCSEMLKSKNIKYRAENSGAVAIVAHSSNFEVVEEVRDELDLEHYFLVGGDREGWKNFEEALAEGTTGFESSGLKAEDPMTINYTSGTTGDPKPVLHKHRWIAAHKQITGRFWWGIDQEELSGEELIWATTAPGWAKWYWSPIGVGLANGLTQLLYHGSFDPETYLDFIEKYEVTHLCATPTEYRMFSQVENLDKYEFKLETALSAGEPLNVEPIEKFQNKFNVTIRDGYGQTESVCLACNRSGMEVKPGSMGKPTPGPDATVVDEGGDALPSGEIGEIVVKKDNPGIFDGYWKSPELDEETFGEAWYRTGDLAQVDEDGYFWFEGRADDIIISSGYRIGPFEVEDSLVSHPAVKEAAAVGKPHEERGQIVKGMVVLSSGYSPSEELVEELQNHVKNDTAPYKYPREIEFVQELPKTSSGKIRRKELREEMDTG